MSQKMNEWMENIFRGFEKHMGRMLACSKSLIEILASTFWRPPLALPNILRIMTAQRGVCLNLEMEREKSIPIELKDQSNRTIKYGITTHHHSLINFP
jgi:hypothetical protein